MNYYILCKVKTHSAICFIESACILTKFIIIIILLHALGRLTCSGIDALPLFPGASTISSSSRFVVDGVFRQSGVVRSFKVVDTVFNKQRDFWSLSSEYCIITWSSAKSNVLR